MIVKMTILRLLGSSDDKEREDMEVHPTLVGRIDVMMFGA